MNKRGGVLSDSALEIGAGVLIVIIFLTFLNFVVPRASGEGFKDEVLAKDIALSIKAISSIPEDMELKYTTLKGVELEIKKGFVQAGSVKINTVSNLEVDFSKQTVNANQQLLISKRGNKLEVKAI